MARSRVMRQLLAIVEAYYDEPEASGSDATERDLDCFARLMAVLARHRRRARRLRPACMEEYCVRWEIDLSARSALDAARKAHEVQLRPDSLATIFEVVRPRRRTGKLDWRRAETIDLTGVLGHGQTEDSRR